MIDFQGKVLHFIIVQQVSGNPRTLCHPIQPYTAFRTINMIMADGHIHGSMQFQTGYFISPELLVQAYIMDHVISDHTVNGA